MIEACSWDRVTRRRGLQHTETMKHLLDRSRRGARGALRIRGSLALLAAASCVDESVSTVALLEEPDDAAVTPRDEPACPDFPFSHHVAQEIKISGVAFLSQRQADCGNNNYLCGYTATNMLTARLHGVTPTIEFTQKMAKAVKGSVCPGPSEMSELVTAARTIGNAKGTACYTMTFDQLKGVLSTGEPAVVLVWNQSLEEHRCDDWNGGHTLVVLGYSASRQVWFVHDPLCANEAEGSYREIPSATFRSAVKDAWIPAPGDKASVILVRR